MSQYNADPSIGKDEGCIVPGCWELAASGRFCTEHAGPESVEDVFASRPKTAPRCAIEHCVAPRDGLSVFCTAHTRPEVPKEEAARDAWAQVQKLQDNGYRAEFGMAFYANVTDEATGRRSKKFLPALLAEAITGQVPIAKGVDSQYWSYEGGVWKADPHVVRDMVVRNMGENYKPAQTTQVEHIISARCPVIECEPVPKYINFKNGLLDWRTGELVPHTPEVLSTVQLAVDYDPDAECPEFDKYLATVVPEDMIETMWDLTGYLMYSGNPLQKAVMFTGTGRNGKGTYIRAMNALLGKHNISSASLQSITENRFTAASLFGKIANICGDIDGTYIESTGMFKMITGEDLIPAERKGRDQFFFTNWAVPLFSANRVPGSADVSTGYMSRWVVIPFPHSFEGREDRGLDDRLQIPGELRGIAAKAIPALRRLMERKNFNESESAKAAMDDFKRRVDQVRTWIDEEAELTTDEDFTSRTVLYNAYKVWSHDGGYGQLRSSEFYDRLQAIGVKPAKVRGNRGFRGIRLAAQEGPSAVPAFQDPTDDPWEKTA